MTKFFQFKKEIPTRERTPMWAASIAINPARAIANKEIAEIRLSKASFSGSGSPGRVSLCSSSPSCRRCGNHSPQSISRRIAS